MENDYVMIINQAINYIYKNLDKSLTVEEIAAECCFSKYYFNRVFKLIVGENVYSFIKRIKLESAAFKLRATRNITITDIALAAGYSPSNFASAFKQYFGISASEYRKRNEVPVKDSFAAVTEHILTLKKRDNIFEELDGKIKIKRMEAMNLVYKRFMGNYHQLKPCWELFCTEMEQQFGLGNSSQFVGISYDDPIVADEDRCIYDMCMVVKEPIGVNVHQITAGLYACYEYHGKIDELILVFNEIFALWLPFCPYKVDDRLSLEFYHTGLDEAGNISLDICIPLQDIK